MLRVDVVDTEQGFQALGDEWRELICQCPDATYHLTWEFTCHWWKYFASGRHLWVLTARDMDGTLVGIAPFAVARDRVGPFTFRRLEFLYRVQIPFQYVKYYLDGENVDIIAHPAFREEVDEAFIRLLDSTPGRWDTVDLAWLSSDSCLRSYLRDRHRLSLERRSQCAFAILPDDFATFERTIMGKSESKQVRKDARRLEREYPGQVEYVRITDRDDIAPALLNLDQMKSRRWDDKGEAMPDGDDPHVRLHQGFERDFSESAFDRGWLRLYQLRVGDDIIASDWNVVLHGTQYSLKTGFDPDWKVYSPGNAIQVYENQQLISEGVRKHDLLHGTIETKRKWSNAEREDVREIAVTSWRGIPYFTKVAGGWMVDTHGRRLAKRLIPGQARAWLNHAVETRTQRMRS